MLLYSSSRTQRVAALSSGEVEVYASSSAACDAMFLARILHFIVGSQVMIHHFLDSSAARGILRRQGVGLIIHLSCSILRLQNLVNDHHVISKHLKLMVALQSWLMMLQQYQV